MATTTSTTALQDDSSNVEQTQYSGTPDDPQLPTTTTSTTVVAQVPTQGLANTGSDAGVLVTIAVMLFVVGALFMRASRKVRWSRDR